MSKIFKILFLPIFIGVFSGILSSLFLHALNGVTEYRHAHPQLIWGLPFFGLIFAFILRKIPHHINQGVPYFMEELDNEKAVVSPWMVPFIFISSLGTHLFGGSAGREGVGVIMGAGIAHVLPRFHRGLSEMRRFLIYGGIAAGFSSIFGTPIAAIMFAHELHSFKHIKQFDLLVCTALASFVAWTVPLALGPGHQHFHVSMPEGEVILYVLMVGIISGLGAHFFYWGLKGYTKLISHLLPHLALKLFVGGLLVCLMIFFTNGYQYAGIGTDVIAQSFLREMSYYDFAMKALLTVMTLSIGFKGGEVTPLFFMGATLSNWACGVFQLKNFSLSSALGMVGLFGAVTGTPVASSLMALELFGWKVGGLSLVSCFMAKVILGKRSVYRH